MGVVQRSPNGLLQLLGLRGVELLPSELERSVRGALDLLQFYGQSQLQGAFNNNAAVAEGAPGLTLALPTNDWCVLFSVNGAVVKTATMTALRARVTVTRRTSPGNVLVAVEELGPFGADETGTVNLGGMLPYPLLCPPGSLANCTLEILGADATANVSVLAEFGLLG